MQRKRHVILRRVIAVLAWLLIVKIVIVVVLSYRNYMPPNFASDFLLGRKPYFFHGYHLAFYTHILSGPLSLVLGMILVNEPFRRRFTPLHRVLGRIQVANILLLVAPSGLWMSWYSMTGLMAGSGFASLAIATGFCVLMGWRRAVQRRIAEHRRWMWRCFLLLCSAVVLRMIGGLATVADSEAGWIYPAAAWASWLVPLVIYEAWTNAGWLQQGAYARN